MMNKKYEKPDMKIIPMNGPELLASSGEEDDPWWKPPEEKEGCETPWWCP